MRNWIADFRFGFRGLRRCLMKILPVWCRCGTFLRLKASPVLRSFRSPPPTTSTGCTGLTSISGVPNDYLCFGV